MKKVAIGWVIFLLIVSLIVIFFIWQDSFSFLITIGDKLLGSAIVIIVALVLSHFHNVVFFLVNKVMRFNFRFTDRTYIDTDDKKTNKSKKTGPFDDLTSRLREQYGFFWRRKVRKCLVLGSPQDTELLAPDLMNEHWQLSDTTLMLYAGEVTDEPNLAWLTLVKKHFGRIIGLRRKPIDAIIWLLPAHYLTLNRRQQTELEQTVLTMRARNKVLGWQAPIYLVSTQDYAWLTDTQIDQSVGALFTSLTLANLNEVDKHLTQLSQQSCHVGMQQVITDPHQAFLLQLSQRLVQQDHLNIKQWFTKWLSLPKVPDVRGLLFVPKPRDNEQRNDETENWQPQHYLQITPTWQTISDDAIKQSGKRMGFAWESVFCSLIMVCMGLMIMGLGVSYVNNQTLIRNSEQLVNQIEQGATQDYAVQLAAQYALQLQLEQLLHRQAEGSPIVYRFGLNKNQPILDALWYHYYTANERNISTPFLHWSDQYLTHLAAMSPADPERQKWTNSGYDVLKSYLMLGQPDKTDVIYLSDFAAKMWPAPTNIEVGEWQRLMPELVRFWGQSIVINPEQKVALNSVLIKDVRQILINQIGVQNAETTIYQAILQRARQNYADVTLVQLLGDIDSRMLFSSQDEIPGVFTRKAWDDMIKNEIAQAARSRQEQIDWVLSDGSQTMTASISPDTLKQHLTDRYFADYSAAWLMFLNNITWRPADNVADVIEQLTLMSDVRQSPVIALMNVVKYHAEVAYTGGGLGDELVRSAQQLTSNRNPAKLLDNKVEASGPLTPTFAPVLNLLGSDNQNDLSLQTYLLRVTQVRLKLQNITSSANPQAMAKDLAKSVFQGTSIDLTDTRDYGNLIAANLGEEWLGFGHSIFKQPLEQSWHVILTPAASSFNDTWQKQIVAQWEKSFAGRYPFKDSTNDASMAELARFLRPDAGIIDKFINNELSGVLEKQGDNWVINPVTSQGLRFSAEFIDTLNLFNELSNQLLASGDAQMSFDLMARSGYNVARNELIIDKQKLNYFNQMPMWHRFVWPGDGYSPYAQLSWSSDESSLQLYEYHAGDWAFIRLLESAFVKPIDSSRYELVWLVPGDRKLKYILRSQLGQGPLTLLKLRNFTLPKKVFENDSVTNISLTNNAL